MPRKSIVLALVAGCVGTIFSVHPASACGPCTCDQYDLDAIPSFSRALPLNPRMFARLQPDAGAVPWIRASDGAEIPSTMTPAGGPDDAFWISPTSPLEPATEYHTNIGYFTTGSAPDVTPPVLGGVRVELGEQYTAYCTPIRGAVLTIASIDDGDVSNDGVVVQLDVTGPSGTERLFIRAQTWTLPQQFLFGTADDPPCLGGRSMRNAAIGDSYSALVTVFDTAGNTASADVSSFQVRATTPGGCGDPALGIVDSGEPASADAGALRHADPAGNGLGDASRGCHCSTPSAPGDRRTPDLVLVGLILAVLGSRRHPKGVVSRDHGSSSSCKVAKLVDR